MKTLNEQGLDLKRWVEQDNTDLRRLEEMIDQYGLSVVLSMIADICIEKADHITANWQDKCLALRYDLSATKINTLSLKINDCYQI